MHDVGNPNWHAKQNANGPVVHLLEKLNAPLCFPKVHQVEYNGDLMRWTHFAKYFEANVTQHAAKHQIRYLSLTDRCESEPRARIEIC